MLGFRRHLSWAICVWLASQVAYSVGAPILLSQLTASQIDRDCDCPLGPGQACPMHQNGKHDSQNEDTHGRNHAGNHDDTRCRLRNAFPASDAAMFSQSGAFGILPRPTVTLAVFQPGVFIQDRTPVAIAHASVPEAPPPRT